MHTRVKQIAKPLLKILGAILAIILIAALFIHFAIPMILSTDWPDWTGFNSYTKPDGTFEREKTLWDWLELLIIPLVLAIGGYRFRQAEKRTDEEIAERRRKQEEKIAEERRQQEQKIADDNLQETALQTYLDRMSELLLAQGLHKSQPQDKVRSVARAQTLTILHRLNYKRKGTIILFLYESQLINTPTGTNLWRANLETIKDTAIVNLQGADLQGADLQKANLWGALLPEVHLQGAHLKEIVFNSAHLEGAHLTGAHLEGAYLYGANLHGAHLKEAHLKGAILRTAVLNYANLQGADLQGAYLEVVNPEVPEIQRTYLHGAHLEEAHLEGAYLQRADFEGAHLEGAHLEKTLLQEAKFYRAHLEGAHLQGAHLEGAHLEGAYYNNKTQWPDGYTPPLSAINTDGQSD